MNSKNFFSSPAVIVSLGLPQGVTFLLNILIELGVPVYTDSARGFWRPDGPHLRAQGYGVRRFGKWLPSLREGLLIPTTNSAPVEWIHEWPIEALRERRCILLTRDGRDALYSGWRRIGAEGNLISYMRNSSDPLGRPLAETWSFFHRLWLAVFPFLPAGMHIRFEDLKADPISETTRIMDFLGLRRSPEAIRVAAELSDVSRARIGFLAADRRSMRDGEVIRSGKVGEWRQTWSKQELAALPRGFGDILSKLGYDPCMEPDTTPTASKSDEGVERLAAEMEREILGHRQAKDDLAVALREAIHGWAATIHANGEHSGECIHRRSVFPAELTGPLGTLRRTMNYSRYRAIRRSFAALRHRLP